ncbi:hypothetical protein THRCLA_22423 [Thraustotheca clavata]|uniref:Uncharacterized protein n=1 Tax=Thraustotheca clavata TaxID=74557 RepID=A0A1V9Z1T2_9STRA|nr:hypothetical protein THRCLA_22423 [Thraustotheca clavata]
MGQCCSRKHLDDVDVDASKHVAIPTSSPIVQMAPREFQALETTRPVNDQVLEDENNNPLPDKVEEPQKENNVYVPPEDRPIESTFIHEERKRLAMIQEQLRLQREAAEAKWQQELNEKKHEFLPS